MSDKYWESTDWELKDSVKCIGLALTHEIPHQSIIDNEYERLKKALYKKITEELNDGTILSD